jgi:hypothetical protein
MGTEISKGVATPAQACVSRHFDLSPLIPQTYSVDGRGDHPLPTLHWPLQGESNFSGVFSIFSNAAEEEDNKMIKSWQKDADGILIFVSPLICI